MKWKRGKSGHVEGNRYEVRDGYAVGFTAKGEEFYLDAEDIDKAKCYTWHLDIEGYASSTVNNYRGGTSYHKKLHRVVMGLEHKDGKLVDHINRAKNDNRKENLRIVSVRENAFNQGVSRKNKSGVLGVFYRQRKGKTPKWVASINIEGNTRQIGHFDTMDEAVKARKEAETKYYAIKHS